MSTSTNKFNIGDTVVIIGSENIKWVVKTITKNNDYIYIYSIELTDGDFYQTSLSWVPESLLLNVL